MNNCKKCWLCKVPERGVFVINGETVSRSEFLECHKNGYKGEVSQRIAETSNLKNVLHKCEKALQEKTEEADELRKELDKAIAAFIHSQNHNRELATKLQLIDAGASTPESKREQLAELRREAEISALKLQIAKATARLKLYKEANDDK